MDAELVAQGLSPRAADASAVLFAADCNAQALRLRTFCIFKQETIFLFQDREKEKKKALEPKYKRLQLYITEEKCWLIHSSVSARI